MARELREYPAGSPPSILAATVISFASLEKKLPSLLVEGTLGVFDFGPLTMTRHGSDLLIG